MSKCNCFDNVLEKITKELKSQLTEKEAETLSARWEHQAFVVIGNTMTTKIGMPIAYEYRKFKKSGEPYRNRTCESVKLMMTFCPFCGERIKEKVEEA